MIDYSRMDWERRSIIEAPLDWQIHEMICARCGDPYSRHAKTLTNALTWRRMCRKRFSRKRRFRSFAPRPEDTR